MTAYESDFYFYLLREYYLHNRENPFSIPNKKIELELGIPRKTIIELRKRLQEKGLITFSEGERKAKSPEFTILQVESYVTYSNIKGNIKDVNVTEGNIKGNNKGNIKSRVNNVPVKDTKDTKNNKSSLSPGACAYEDSLDPMVELEIMEQKIRDEHSGWIETFSMNNGISLEEFWEYFRGFVKHLQNQGETKKGAKDFIKHFANFHLILKSKPIKTNNNGTKYESVSERREREAAERNRRSAERIARMVAEDRQQGCGGATTEDATGGGFHDEGKPEHADYPFG